MSDYSNIGSKQRLGSLDGLRGIAALAVFGVHYNQIVGFDKQIGPFDSYLLFANGEYGVVLFFILSGLLLSLPFWKSILYQTDWPDLKTYAIRRLVRILPAYYVALSVLILLSGYWQYPQAWTDILLHYIFLFNYAEFSIFSINAPFWTLAVEVQFYCLLPLLFFVLRKCSVLKIVNILLLSSIVSYGLHFWLVSSINQTIAWPGSSSLTWIRPYGAVVTHSLLAHIPHFIIGILCGGLLLQLGTNQNIAYDKGTWGSEVMFWMTLCLILILLTTESGEWLQIPFGRYGLPIVPVLLGIMIISTQYAWSAHQLLDSRPLRIMGTLSYGIYIYHFPILGLVDKTMAESAIDAREHWGYLAIISFSLTILTAAASYLLIERPILKKIHQKN